jgi:hypothetical protein
MNFRNCNDIYQLSIDDKNTMCITNYSPSLGIVYFINYSTKINIPEDIYIYDETHKCIQSCYKKSQFYLLCWTDSYSIHYKHECILSLTSERSWELSTLTRYMAKIDK